MRIVFESGRHTQTAGKVLPATPPQPQAAPANLWGRLRQAFRYLSATQPPVPPIQPPIVLPSRPHNPYRGASVDRLTGDWIPRLLSADYEARGALITLRARCRELVRNDDYAQRIISLIVKNVVGPRGMQLEPKLKDEDAEDRALEPSAQASAGKRAKKPAAVTPEDIPSQPPLAEETNQELKRAWKMFSKRGQCTVDGKMSMADLQRLAVRIWATDGECFIRKVPGFRNKTRFAYQFIDCDRIDANYNRFPIAPNSGQNEIRMGVEVDEWRRPVAYWILKRHASEGGGGQYHDRIPAEEIQHFYVQERADQTRGIPLLHTAMSRMHQLAEYQNAELTAARVAACMMGFVTTKTGEDYAGGAKDDVTGQLQITVAPGVFEQLPANSEVKEFNPQHPNAAFSEFTKRMLHSASAGADVSYASLTNDLREVNFSSIRQGVLDERDTWRLIQAFLADALLQPLFEAWFDVALLSKQLQIPLPNDEQRDEIFSAIHWQGRGWTWVDPLKDVAAALDALGAGLSTLEKECAERGLDWREVLQQRKRELQYADKLGLDLQQKGVGTTPKTAQDFGQPGIGQPGDGEPQPGKNPDNENFGQRRVSHTRELIAAGEGRE